MSDSNNITNFKEQIENLILRRRVSDEKERLFVEENVGKIANIILESSNLLKDNDAVIKDTKLDVPIEFECPLELDESLIATHLTNAFIKQFDMRMIFVNVTRTNSDKAKMYASYYLPRAD